MDAVPAARPDYQWEVGPLMEMLRGMRQRFCTRYEGDLNAQRASLQEARSLPWSHALRTVEGVNITLLNVIDTELATVEARIAQVNRAIRAVDGMIERLQHHAMGDVARELLAQAAALGADMARQWIEWQPLRDGDDCCRVVGDMRSVPAAPLPAATADARLRAEDARRRAADARLRAADARLRAADDRLRAEEARRRLRAEYTRVEWNVSGPHVLEDMSRPRLAPVPVAPAAAPLSPRPATSYPAPWPEEPAAPDDAADSALCVLCLARVAATVNVPCGHACACVTCAAGGQLTACPMCRAALTTIVRVYR